jgi:hypothetical protein
MIFGFGVRDGRRRLLEYEKAHPPRTRLAGLLTVWRALSGGREMSD